LLAEGQSGIIIAGPKAAYNQKKGKTRGTMKKRFLYGLVIVAVLSPTIAWAIHQPDQKSSGSITSFSAIPLNPILNSTEPTVVEKKTLAAQTTLQSQRWQRFTGKAGRWQAHWNKDTRTPHLATGTPMRLTVGPLTPANIEAACMDFVRSNQDLLGATPANLRRIQAVRSGGRWYTAFEQTHNGIPVLGGNVRMSFTKDDRLIAFGSDVLPDVNVDTNPKFDGKAALDLARTDCRKTSDGIDRIGEPKLCIVPTRSGTVTNYALCWQFDILQSKIQKKWQYLIDAHSGSIISKRNTLWYDYAYGTVRGEYKPEFASDPTVVEPFVHEQVLLEGQELPVYSWNFDTDPGWLTEGAWAFGQPTGAGSHCGDPTSGATGSNVYGYNLSGDYPNNMPIQYLTTTPIDCTGHDHLRLKFKRWLGIEGYGWDRAFIEASHNGTDWTLIWEHGGDATCDGKWVPVQYDISAVADNQPTVFIRWGISSDQSITYPGWNIDDVKIVSVQGGTNTALTQYGGRYAAVVPWNPSTLSSQLSGSYAQINYVAGSNAAFTHSPVSPHDTIDWTWNSSLYNVIDESSAYRHVNFVHDYYKVLDPTFTGMDYPVPTFVYVDFSNAYWDGENIVFGKGDGVEFDDFALYAEVIYHEYTHGITDKIYTGFSLPYVAESGAMNEGWSDYFGCLLSPSQNPLMGDGGLVIGDPNGFRSLMNTYRRETDWANEVHFDSQMFSGSLWEARVALGGAVMDGLVHFARYGHATTYEDYLIALLLEDDTRYGDNDLSNGTPHSQAIYTAFGNHGIGGLQYLAPSIVITNDTINHDGHLDPGETASLSLALTNGWADACDVHAALSTSDPCVTISKAVAAFPNVTFGGQTDNSSDPFVVSVNPACPETHTIRLILTVSAKGPYEYSRTCLLYYCVASSQLTYDDGEPEDIVNYGLAGGGLAVKVTPDSYPSYPTHVRLFPYGSTDIAVTIWGQDPNGDPGEMLGSVMVHPPATGDWFDVDISQLGLVINSGSVFVGWVEGPGAYANGFDFDPPYYQRSWAFSGSQWYAIERFGYMGNFMIRMRYTDQPPLRITEPFERAWCPGQPVSSCLSATGGAAPYHSWTAIPLAQTYNWAIRAIEGFPTTGTPQNVHDDDASFEYTLPFSFPYYGTAYTSVNICTNGFLDFVDKIPYYDNSTQQLIDSVRIAPLWDDFATFASDDIYIDQSIAGQVTIRWQAHSYPNGNLANFAVVLFSDGRIRFDYGTGNIRLSPTVGISAGDGARYIVVGGYDSTTTLTNAKSVLFTPVPSMPSLPPGVSLDAATGCFSGAPTVKGTYVATITVTDSSPQPQVATRDITFTVGPIPADFDSNCRVDFKDYAILCSQWLSYACGDINGWCNGADLDQSGNVDYTDLAIFSNNWLNGF
jgi:hypothetical protein